MSEKAKNKNISVTIVVDEEILTIKMAKNENILEAIKGQGLRVDLEASNDMTFEDLYTEQQRVFTVDYYRDGELLFNGWLKLDP